MVARFLLTCSFFGTITYIPLMLVNERGLSLGAAGTILAVGSLGWSVGSWIQGHDRWVGRRHRLVSGRDGGFGAKQGAPVGNFCAGCVFISRPAPDRGTSCSVPTGVVEVQILWVGLFIYHH